MNIFLKFRLYLANKLMKSDLFDKLSEEYFFGEVVDINETEVVVHYDDNDNEEEIIEHIYHKNAIKGDLKIGDEIVVFTLLGKVNRKI